MTGARAPGPGYPPGWDPDYRLRPGHGPDDCPSCGAVLEWLSDDGRGVGECPRCATYGAHGGGCHHAPGEETSSMTAYTYTPTPATPEIADRLEYLRGEIEAERISYGEIAELTDLAEYIDPSDVLLREWAGVPEFDDDEETDR